MSIRINWTNLTGSVIASCKSDCESCPDLLRSHVSNQKPDFQTNGYSLWIGYLTLWLHALHQKLQKHATSVWHQNQKPVFCSIAFCASDVFHTIVVSHLHYQDYQCLSRAPSNATLGSALEKEFYKPRQSSPTYFADTSGQLGPVRWPKALGSLLALLLLIVN